MGGSIPDVPSGDQGGSDRLRGEYLEPRNLS